MVIGSDGLWDVMSSGDVVGFVNEFLPKDVNDKDTVLTEARSGVAEALVNEARCRWEENNKNKKNSSKVGDVPYLKYEVDDISAVIAFFEYK